MKKTLVVLAAGMVLGAFGMSDAAQSGVAQVFGAYRSHQTEEQYSLSVGATAAGNQTRPRNRREIREAVVVPEHYGRLVAVTPAPGAAVVWYQDGAGVVRNVVLSEPSANLYRLEERPATRRQVWLAQ